MGGRGGGDYSEFEAHRLLGVEDVDGAVRVLDHLLAISVTI
jgi:hypothetical protein